MEFVLASSNPGKLAEFREIFRGSQFRIISQTEYNVPDAEETGSTFEENALLKARHASHLTGMPAIADDSGLEVDALDGRPGIRSARYAGEKASDRENIEKLLTEMERIPKAKRGARFQCVIAMVRRYDDPDPVICRGSWEGTIGATIEGSNGFGYDPVFRPKGFDCSTAQLTSDVKNCHSHRAQALNAFRSAVL